VSWYQKNMTNLDFTEARYSEWQWHHLGHMQVCTSTRQITTQFFTGQMTIQHQSTEGTWERSISVQDTVLDQVYDARGLSGGICHISLLYVENTSNQKLQ